MNEVYLPMLTRVDSGVIVWQPPENLNATGGGGEQNMRNLVSDPGFEEGTAHWTMTAGDSYVYEVDPNGANIRPHGGKKMLYSAASSELFEVHAGRTLRVAVWYTNGAPGRLLRVAVAFDGGTPQNVIYLHPSDRATVWKRYESTIEVPPNTTKAQLVISSEYGRFDDIEVIEVI